MGLDLWKSQGLPLGEAVEILPEQDIRTAAESQPTTRKSSTAVIMATLRKSILSSKPIVFRKEPR